MKHLPDPGKYEDPIRYFRDSHGVINEALVILERLLGEIASIGLEKSLTQNAEAWDDVLHFFKRSGPRHEHEEEQALFPILKEKLPSIGFRSATDPAKFLSAEHFEMRRLTRSLVDIWNQFKADGLPSVERTADFQRVGKDLLDVYKQHIAKENEIIYKLANEELLDPDERQLVMDVIGVLNSPQSSTAIFSYDQSDYSDVSKGDIRSGYGQEFDTDDEESQ